ncbi:girdin homolog [Paramacrobiotus metropolitanus]|uniref:girdin homolog n=1 Tax=Paramacrobiotus metropolitanus TaxID=2943436 RepID=UPI00244655AF|nr:girdin homolog [Paramacrobiotus metropolitanus]
MAPQRRFKAKHHLLLLDEVNTISPYFARNKEQAWKTIAENLNKIPDQMFGGDNLLDGVACKNRVEILVKAFRSEDVRNVVKSGTEEQYGDIEKLLTNVSAAALDWETQREARAALKKQEQGKRDTELEEANKAVEAAGEVGIVEQVEVTDEELVAMGAMDPAELNNCNVKMTRTAKRFHLVCRKERPAPNLVKQKPWYLSFPRNQLRRSASAKWKMQEKEIEAQKEMKDKELQMQKELKEMELQVEKEVDLKALENDRLRIAAEERKWEAMLACMKK